MQSQGHAIAGIAASTSSTPVPGVVCADTTVTPAGKASPKFGFQIGENHEPAGPLFFAVSVITPAATVTVNGRSAFFCNSAASAAAMLSAVAPAITPTANISSRIETDSAPLSVAGPVIVMVLAVGTVPVVG